MRKVLILLVAVFMLSLGLSTVAAQDATPIEYGQTVEGTVDNSTYEVEYTFTGSAGDLVAITMNRLDTDSQIDAALVLRKGSFLVATNDDFSYPLSLIVVQLPDDGDYTILATRSGGATGSTEGDFYLKVELVEPLASGSTVEATLFSDYEKQVPSVFYLAPEEDGPVKISYSQEIGELYGSLRIQETPDWANDPSNSYYTYVLDLGDTNRVTDATFSLDLQAGHIYILSINVAFGSYSFNSEDATVTLSVS
jgi:hypothetical protein